MLFTRRHALRTTTALGTTAALAGTGLLAPRSLRAEIPTADVAPPEYAIEDGAELTVLPPFKFVQRDESLFLENPKKFTEATGLPVKDESDG